MSNEGNEERKETETPRNGEIFQALAHKVRRAIIRSLAEKGERSFTELMEDAGLEDSSVMAFHMKKLGPLVRRNERGYYELTDLGWKAYKVLRELELESLRDRAEEVLEEIRSRKPVTKEVSKPKPQAVITSEGVSGEDALSVIGSVISEVVKTISEAVKDVMPTDIFREVLSRGRVWIDKSAPPAPKVRIDVVGSDITLTGATNSSIRIRGTTRHENDATIKASGNEARVKVKGMDGEVSIPEVNALEILVKGGDLTTQDFKLPPNVSISVLGGDVNLDTVMEELSNLNTSVKGGDLLANILVKEVGQNASVNITVLGGDTHITLRVPKNTKVVRGSIKVAGGDVGIEIDESLTGAGEGARTLVINTKIIGGDASISVLPNTRERRHVHNINNIFK